MTTVTTFREAIAAQYGGLALYQALKNSKEGAAIQFKSYEQDYVNNDEDSVVPAQILDSVRAIVAAHVAQQAVQAAVVAEPAPIVAEVAPVAKSRCSTRVVVLATALAAAALAFTASQYRV
jgi:hypothetical protein